MSQHNRINIPAFSKDSSQGADDWAFLESLPDELVGRAVKSLARREFEKRTISNPSNGNQVNFIMSEAKVRHNPCSGIIKWVRGCFIKKNI